MKLRKWEKASELDRAKLIIALWHATFSKYESWDANKVPSGDWPQQVLKDFRKLSKISEGIIFK